MRWMTVLLGFLVLSAFADEPGMKLTWSDEFSVDGPPDPTKWDFERGYVRNKEWQRYTDKNAYCSNGWLVIEARKGRGLTSASVITKGKKSFGYGVLEIRAKFEAKQDLWPALWMMGATTPQTSWPVCGEIDIFEYYDDSILANFCWADALRKGEIREKWNTKKIPIGVFAEKTRGWKRQWHVWRLERTPDHLVISLDGEVLTTQMQAFARNGVDVEPLYPFREPMYLLMNLAVKRHDNDCSEPAVYPARFLIDYVRFYEPSGDGK